MAATFPNLFCDNSALCSPNRWRTLPRLLDGPLRDRVVHGSDYPVPSGGFGPWLSGHLSWSNWRASSQLENPIRRDEYLKTKLGFAPETFTRLDAVTGLSSAWSTPKRSRLRGHPKSEGRVHKLRVETSTKSRIRQSFFPGCKRVPRPTHWA